MDEFKRRGDAIYERDIKPWAEPGHDGQFVAIDIETGQYEMGDDPMAVTDRRYARLPDAQPWGMRVGTRYGRRFGGRRWVRPA